MAYGMILLYLLIFWAIVVLVAALVLRHRYGRPTRTDARIEELEARYARGDISHAEYEALKLDLERGAWRRRRAG